ncbi:hypothetical protein ACXR2W_08050 [Leucobacter sp. HY1908]
MTQDDAVNRSTDDAGDDARVGGFALSELADYAASGRTPLRDDIERSVEARHAVAQLERLRQLADEVASRAGAGATESPWFHRVLHDLKQKREP